MDEHFRLTIAEVQKRIVEGEKQVQEDKRTVNKLAVMAGAGVIYPDADLQTNSIGLTIRSDQFYGQPFATSVRDILVMRKALNQGAATINEIYGALVEGGFRFDTKIEENAKRGMRISLAKNNTMFHKLPSGTFGLREWYPNAKPTRPGKLTDADSDDTDEEGAEDGSDK